MIHFIFQTVIIQSTGTSPRMPIETHRQRNLPQNPREMAEKNGLTLLLADTDGAATTTSRFGVLATHTKAPVVTQTAVRADLLQALQVLTNLAVHAVRDYLRILAVRDIALSVQKPRGDFVLGWGLEDGDDSLELFSCKFTGAVGKNRQRFVLSMMMRWSYVSENDAENEKAPLPSHEFFHPILPMPHLPPVLYTTGRRRC